MSENILPALKDRLAVDGRDGISNSEAYALVEVVEAAAALYQEMRVPEPDEGDAEYHRLKVALARLGVERGW